MSTFAIPAKGEARRQAIAERVRDARRAAGLTQRELGARLGVTLWTMEQIEAGKVDAGPHAVGLAAATGRSAEWFAPQLFTVRAPADEERTPAVAADAPYGRHILIGTIAVLVVIRFFTEVFHLLPGALNFVDVPLLALVAFAAIVFPVRGRLEGTGLGYAPAALLFIAVCTASVLANPDRIAGGPVLLFLYGFLGPIAFGYAAYRLWPVGNARAMSRALFALALLQFAVVIVVDAPRFVASGANPDTIGGTFGANPYQLVFFLMMVIGLCAGMATFERGTLVARLAPFVVAGSFLVIFFAQYRALLLSTLVALVVLGLMLAPTRGRGLLFTLFALAAFVVAFNFVADRHPGAKLGSTAEAFSDDPKFFVTERFSALGDVANVYVDVPHATAAGTGPGTYSSRAWRTFADLTSGESEVVATTIRGVTGGAKYRTDVSERYIVPKLVQAEAVLGSKSLKSPLSSYTSLLAEVGILGFVIMIGIYVTALSRSMRMAMAVMRRPRRLDPLPGLLLASSTSMLLLLQMALLENWLEVIRTTVPAWIVFAVALKEYRARALEEAEQA